MDKTIEDELDALNKELRAYVHMRRVRMLIIESATADIESIDKSLDKLYAQIQEIEHVHGSVRELGTTGEDLQT